MEMIEKFNQTKKMLRTCPVFAISTLKIHPEGERRNSPITGPLNNVAKHNGGQNKGKSPGFAVSPLWAFAGVVRLR